MKNVNKIQLLLWVSLVLALAGSLRHVAWSFGTLESGEVIPGYIQAVAIDLGLVSLAYGVQSRRRERRGTLAMWIGVAIFSAISAYANLLHGLKFASELGLGYWEVARPFVLSAVLPVLVVYLSEIVSQDVQNNVVKQEREQRRVERATERSVEQPEQNTEHVERNVLTGDVPERFVAFVSEHPDASYENVMKELGLSSKSRVKPIADTVGWHKNGNGWEQN